MRRRQPTYGRRPLGRLDRQEHPDVRLLPQRPGDRPAGSPPPGRPFSHSRRRRPARVGHDRSSAGPLHRHAPGRPGSPRRRFSGDSRHDWSSRRREAFCSTPSRRRCGPPSRGTAAPHSGQARRSSASACRLAAAGRARDRAGRHARSRLEPVVVQRQPAASALSPIAGTDTRCARGQVVRQLVRLARRRTGRSPCSAGDRQVVGERADHGVPGRPAGGQVGATTGGVARCRSARTSSAVNALVDHTWIGTPLQPVGDVTRASGSTWYWYRRLKRPPPPPPRPPPIQSTSGAGVGPSGPRHRPAVLGSTPIVYLSIRGLKMVNHVRPYTRPAGQVHVHHVHLVHPQVAALEGVGGEVRRRADRQHDDRERDPGQFQPAEDLLQEEVLDRADEQDVQDDEQRDPAERDDRHALERVDVGAEGGRSLVLGVGDCRRAVLVRVRLPAVAEGAWAEPASRSSQSQNSGRSANVGERRLVEVEGDEVIRPSPYAAWTTTGDSARPGRRRARTRAG